MLRSSRLRSRRCSFLARQKGTKERPDDSATLRSPLLPPSQFPAQFLELNCHYFISNMPKQVGRWRPKESRGRPESPLEATRGKCMQVQPTKHTLTTRKLYADVPTQSRKRVKGGTSSHFFSLAGCRGGTPCRLPTNHAKTVCRCPQAKRAKGSREELPCGVQRQRLW